MPGSRSWPSSMPSSTGASVPHWRFEKGINLRRAILEHKNFDLVMWLTGAGVMPFLEDGAAVSSESWDQMVRAFEGNFFGYSIWFN